MPKAKKERLHHRVAKATKEQAFARYQKHYHSSNPHHKKHILADSILGVLVLVLSVLSIWLVFFYQAAVLREQIELTVTPEVYAVRSGDALSYEVRVKNTTGQALQDTYLEIPQGSGFLFGTSSPLPSDEGIIPLGTIDHEEAILIEVKGTALVDINEHIRLHAILHYRPGITGVQQKFSSELVTVTGSTLELTWELPETIIANQPFPFEIAYENTSETTRFDQVSFIPNFPPGLEVLDTSRPYNEEVGAFTLESIGSLKRGEITGRLVINTADIDTALLEVAAYSAPSGKPLLQSFISERVPVRLPNITADFTAQQNVVSPGGTLSTTVRIENKEPFPLRDLSVKYRLNRAIFSGTNLSGGIDAEGYYTKQIASIVGVEAVQTVPQTFSLRSSINPELAFGNLDTQVIIDAQLFYTDAQGQVVQLPLDALVLDINTDLTARAYARYYSIEGDQIGRGPLPPVVGETTKYWVFVELDNHIHSAEAITVTADLGPGVSYGGKSSVTAGEALVIDQGSNRITWQLDSLPGYKTNFGDKRYGFALEVALTPTGDQVGNSIVLLRNIEVQGRDAETGLVVSSKAPLVTNNLLQDAYATDTGEVQL